MNLMSQTACVEAHQSVWQRVGNNEPSGDSPAPTKGGRSSHSCYLGNHCGTLQLMSAWDTLNGLRKE